MPERWGPGAAARWAGALVLCGVAGGRAEAQQVGAFSLHGAAVFGVEPSESLRPGARADLSFVLGRFSLGPEAAVYFTGPRSVSPNSSRDENVATLGGVTRYTLATGRWRPVAVVGLGAYFWESNRLDHPTGTYLSGSAGIGVFRTLGDRGSGLSAEARFHQLLQSTGLDNSRRFLTVTAGFTLGW